MSSIYVGANRVQVERKINDLESEQWIFWFYENALYLDEYGHYQRETKRHKFKPLKVYERLKQDRYGGSWRIKESEVPLPDDVKNEALEIFRARISVKFWNDR